ncbi:Protein C35D10.12 [Aphelenchoides avenae]|nr:Protein C35D10.12 [Aphelenchus avenae]
MVSVEELYATELSYTLMEEAFAEALSTLRKVTYYRYYHVFKRGELDELITGTGKLRITHSMYDSANWCAVAARI